MQFRCYFTLYTIDKGLDRKILFTEHWKMFKKTEVGKEGRRYQWKIAEPSNICREYCPDEQYRTINCRAYLIN